MTGPIAAYEDAAARERSRLTALLADGRSSAFQIALCRVTAEWMTQIVRTAPGSALAYEKLGADPKTGFRGADRFASDALKRAQAIVNPQEGSPDEVARVYERYLDLSLKVLKWGQVKQELIVDKERGVQYLILGADPLVGKVMALVSGSLMEWARGQPNTRAFLAAPPEQGLNDMLASRPDLVALMRLVDRLPLDVEVSAVPVDRPAVVEAIELGIGFIPIVGSAVALYEAWSGVDLFGYRLSDLERGVLAASVLLPAAGRLAKAGRALYTETRLVAMYGRDAAAWSRAIAAGERGTAQRRALLAIGTADGELRTTKTIAAAAAKDAAAAIPGIVRGTATTAAPVATAIRDLLQSLTARYPVLGQLDAFALERVLLKGPNPGHLKGQLLEELLESRIVPWLRTREGGLALGIVVPAGKRLEFIPGHLIRDAAKRQLTDGILAWREGERLVVAAVFEAKAGPSAARELSFARDSIATLTTGERAELRANAKDVWREQRDAAAVAGQRYTKTLEDVEREYALSERGGQVRRDIERMSAGVGGNARVEVAGESVEIVFSPTRTKFFGVLPKGVRTATIGAQLEAEKVSYEILAAELTAGQLNDAAASLVPLADAMSAAAP